MPFSTIVGHGRLRALLSRAVARGTLPPSLLLAGPAGVGKRRTALAVAEALNCLTPASSDAVEIDACGTCAACLRIGRGVHPDVIVLEPGDMGSIKIEQVRDVVDRAGYRPFEGRKRVVIVDDAETLVGPAQNALLKTLEEPPSASIFILVSAMPDALLPTVLSRCARLPFAPLSAADVAAVLLRDHDYADIDARAAAADADGSVGRALAAQSVDVAAARGMAQELLERMARPSDPARRLGAARDLTAAKGTSVVERDQLAVCLRIVASLLRDLRILAAGADPRTLANPDLQADLQRLVPAFTQERGTRAFAAVDEALGALERNASPKVVADWLVLQL